MDKTHYLPVDMNAVRVVFFKGDSFEPNKKVLTHDSDFPIPTRVINKGTRNSSGFVDITGIRNGRFLVIGLARDFNNQWVVRCDCGVYSTRTKKSMLNPKNYMDRCEHCRHLLYLKRAAYFKEHGKEISDELLYGSKS